MDHPDPPHTAHPRYMSSTPDCTISPQTAVHSGLKPMPPQSVEIHIFMHFFPYCFPYMFPIYHTFSVPSLAWAARSSPRSHSRPCQPEIHRVVLTSKIRTYEEL
jgi:hypothetical protein